jgi:predicted glycogen debranching enzyme
MDTALPRRDFTWPQGPDVDRALHDEWLISNGLGGYAFGTLAACNTRRYHGLFNPALLGLGRVVLLARMGERLEVGTRSVQLNGEEHEGGKGEFSGLPHLRRFSLEGTLPQWEYEVEGARVVRELVWAHEESRLALRYRNTGALPVRLQLRPWPVFRPHDRPLPREPLHPEVRQESGGLKVDYSSHGVAYTLTCPAPFVAEPQRSPALFYRVEKRRGYDFLEHQESPGYFSAALAPGESLTLEVGLVGKPRQVEGDLFEAERNRQRALVARAPEQVRRDDVMRRLVLAADQYIIHPPRPMDAALREDTRGDARSVIAGYPWFTDWGRDTMISLEGLTLCTGRLRAAAAILRTFRHAVREGLLPNLYPEGEADGVYHTADATLWFFHAIHRYLEHTQDWALLEEFFPTLEDIVARHLAGTRFNIGVDPEDGLLRQGAEGYQLTWMDAKVDGWVVTPRRGKAVELNALWYNALMLMAGWAARLGHLATGYLEAAERTRAAFNARFPNPATGCLFDVVDGEQGDDGAIRPNQVFSIGLPYPVLREELWRPVLQVVDETLLTPVGLRSLAPGHPDFKDRYDGDLRARDAAYHQGTVWSWLIGPYVDAHLKVARDPERVRAGLEGLIRHLDEAGLGQVSEVFDATPPFHARGCMAQAWSVAELLRVLMRLGAEPQEKSGS